MEKQLAVIILNWNGRHLLEKFLPDAVKFTSGDEVDLIVADNGSTDDSLSWLNQNFPEIKVIKFDKNYGFAEGYNRAIAETGYPFTLLLNSDVEVSEGWWRPLLEFMNANPDVGALQPKIKSYNEPDSFEYAGAAGGFLDNLGYPYCRGRLFDRIEKDRGQYNDTIDICWASGAALMVRTALYLELGGLDPLFFAHMEEIDLCCRMIRAGYRICAISDSEVFHLGGGSLNQGNPRKTYLNFRNNLLLLYKNLPKKKRTRKLLLRRLADTLAFVMFAVKFDFPNAKAILKAHGDFRKMKKHYGYINNEEEISFPGSHRNIILDRYLFNRHPSEIDYRPNVK
ncbi:MAG: glycosyltransferase family 2 protein [Muribaculaceae bacterium]|nr:glycosyltransferase family 2 protein [Muribaculaceae bacterium]